MNSEYIGKILESRARLMQGIPSLSQPRKGEEEGGCGVVGFCCSEPVSAKHIYEPSRQMHNRGNGKGGGIAALGFVPEQLGVSQTTLETNYMLHIAFLDVAARQELESKYITANFDVTGSQRIKTVEDWTAVPGLEAKPPDVWRYFVRVKPDVLTSFITKNHFTGLDRTAVEDELVHQNTFLLNQEYYASLGEQKAFVLSEGKNIMILKVVGYAEAITQYYDVEDLKAHVWIAHQRYPTKGRVWHPGGAHPFGGINTALVHNGDFANYQSVCDYLAQRHIYPQFLTDTEVSVHLFDLLNRTYGYPLEYVIETMAPTSELDFDRLPLKKQTVYRAIQATHIHGSPDGPWFFIIAHNDVAQKKLRLMGITDTAMLRPQVFAFSDGAVQVGLICSEKQAIDATLKSLHEEDSRICPIADRYWNARGGSHTDGGAFIFTLEYDSAGKLRIKCTDKFGTEVPMPAATEAYDFETNRNGHDSAIELAIKQRFDTHDGVSVYEYVRDSLAAWSFNNLQVACNAIVAFGLDPKNTQMAVEALTLLNDRKYSTGTKKRNHVNYLVRTALGRLFSGLPVLGSNDSAPNLYRLINFRTRESLRAPNHGEMTLVIDTTGFPSEGEASDASLIMDAFFKGWRHFISYNCCGQRFIGCGLGPETEGITIDVYDSSGDYLGSGIDGLTINVHGNAQDQVGQIVKTGKIVIHGDVGQTFMYGAKGGSVYVLGNAAGRPLINSVGRPRVVINGTCLDFLAESFMAGDVFNDGGFVILNGLTFDDDGRMKVLHEPYPGSNLFSLATGGAIYIRDPEKHLVEQQLNGGQFTELTERDWAIILPYLEENERVFGIKVDELLTVNGQLRAPVEVYRKVAPVAIAALGAKQQKVESE